MPAERLRAAGFYRRHHLELGQADMSGIGPPPRGAVSPEDVSDLQPPAGYPGAGSFQASLHRLVLQPGQHLVGADRVPDRLGGDMGILGGDCQLGMAEQQDHPNIGVGLKQVGGEAVSPGVQRGGLLDARHVLGRGERPVQLPL